MPTRTLKPVTPCNYLFWIEFHYESQADLKCLLLLLQPLSTGIIDIGYHDKPGLLVPMHCLTQLKGVRSKIDRCMIDK